MQVLRARIRDSQTESQERTSELQRQLTLARHQQDRLLNLRLLEEIEAGTFAAKNTELRDKIAQLTLQLESANRERAENAEMAAKAFELSQSLTDKWVTADHGVTRHILEIGCLNFRLDDVTLVPTMRKPFQMLLEGLVWQNSRGEWI